MFDQLSNKFSATLKKISGNNKITASNITDSLEAIRSNLIEADVSLSVITDFIETVKVSALGSQVSEALKPNEAFIKIIQRELQNTLGNTTAELKFTQEPAVILMAGMQGAGKTTASAKLALWLKQQKNKSTLLVSTDIYRPAAMEQLKYLADSNNIACYPSDPSWSVKKIIKQALKHAKIQFIDCVIIDTAGRLHLDEILMDEIKTITKLATPCETLFVVDAMLGQEAATIAQAFNQAVNLTGVILSKADSDTRGGAALSVAHASGRPIKFLSMGEKIADFELFHPERIASRILGMGDILSLIEQAESTIDKHKADKLASKIKKGKRFNLNDLGDQIKQMQAMGGMDSIMAKLPQQMGQMAAQAAASQFNDKHLITMTALLQSMTKKEKRFPDIINNSRKRRITLGSGTNIQDFNKLLKQFKQMSKMSKKMGNKKTMGKMMDQMNSLQSNMGGLLPSLK